MRLCWILALLRLISHKDKSFIGYLKYVSYLDCYMFYIKDKLSVCVSLFLSSTGAWKADLGSLCLIRQYDTDSLPWDPKARTWCESKIPDFLQPLSTQCDFTAWYFKVGNMLCRITAAADVYINRKIFWGNQQREASYPEYRICCHFFKFHIPFLYFFYLALTGMLKVGRRKIIVDMMFDKGGQIKGTINDKRIRQTRWTW